MRGKHVLMEYGTLFGPKQCKIDTSFDQDIKTNKNHTTNRGKIEQKNTEAIYSKTTEIMFSPTTFKFVLALSHPLQHLLHFRFQ